MNFEFIADSELRTSLVSDHGELETCIAGGAWKAAHVLSGSIIEAILVDYLLGSGNGGDDPLKMSLEKLIDAGKAAGVLSSKTGDLSTVVRGYRNLIHPGRVKRLNEVVDEEGARIAFAVVSLVVREVAEKQAQLYGLTAEQLLTKFENDPTAFAISGHLLGAMQAVQLERALVAVLPERYFDLLVETELGHADPTVLLTIARLYRIAYEKAPNTVRASATKKFVAVLREGGGDQVEVWEERFFRASDLEHLSDDERRLVIDHLLARIKEGHVVTPELIAASEGLSAYLEEGEHSRFFDPLIRTAATDSVQANRQAAATRIESEYFAYLRHELEPRLISRLETWVPFLRDRNQEEGAERVEALRDRLLAGEDIPF